MRQQGASRFLSAPLAVGSIIVVLLSAPTLVAQDTPVTPEGTQVATEETPAAAANADELRKESQNLSPASSAFPFRTTIMAESIPEIVHKMY